MVDITRRGFLAWLGLTAAYPKSLFARSSLNVRYVSMKNKPCLRAIARKNESYASMARLYCGSEKYTGAIQSFSDNVPVRQGEPIYIPIDYLRASLKKILAENEFEVYEIDSQGENGIGTLSELAAEFLKNIFDLNERIAIILCINTDINPFTATVYNGQKILVPKSLVKQELIIGSEKRTVVQPQQQIGFALKKLRQNPLRTSLGSINRNLEARDRFGAKRIRTGRGYYGVSRHTGLDLSAPIGTPVYPIEIGIVTSAGQWGGRNGNGVRYQTRSGIEVVYIHLSKVLVKPGQKVDLNTAVGKVGITGNATADNPHVHVQVKKNGRVIDPAPYVLVD